MAEQNQMTEVMAEVFRVLESRPHPKLPGLRERYYYRGHFTLLEALSPKAVAWNVARLWRKGELSTRISWNRWPMPKLARRERGRPRQDARDQLAIDLAAALRMAWMLGAQASRDLAIALLEGHPVPARRRPRGRRPDDWPVTAYETTAATFKGRSGYLLRKSKQMLPRTVVVGALIAALQGEDESVLRNYIRRLLEK
jgi:hypothetical protein